MQETAEPGGVIFSTNSTGSSRRNAWRNARTAASGFFRPSRLFASNNTANVNRSADIPNAAFPAGSNAGEFLPLTQSEASETLFAAYRDAARDAGLDVSGEFSGGCADSGFTAAVGCPTLCSTGPVGGCSASA